MYNLAKEKLRIRSYSEATKDSTVFVEIKKKYDGTVYKRIIPLSERDATSWVSGESTTEALDANGVSWS